MDKRGTWLAVTGVAIGVIVLGGLLLLYNPKPDPSPEPDVQVVTQAPKTTPREQECQEEALQLVQHTPGESGEEWETKELEAHWVQYLQSIQAQGDYSNWSDKPCDLYLQNHTHYANDAVAGGFATITAVGRDLHSVNVRVTLTSNAGTTILLPAGTQFTSDSAGTQNMISAGSVRFTFVQVLPPETEPQASNLRDRGPAVPDAGRLIRVSYGGGDYAARKVMFVPQSSSAPRTQVQDVPSYCVNRWLDVPNSQSQFSVLDAEEERPIGKLVSCLENDSATHEAKQAAVWMISDNLINLTPQELEGKFVDESKSKFLSTAAQLADTVKKAKPTISAAEIEEIRRMSPTDLKEVRSQLLPILLPLLQEEATQEVQRYKDVAGPLLRSCGFNLSDSAFFRQ